MVFARRLLQPVESCPDSRDEVRLIDLDVVSICQSYGKMLTCGVHNLCYFTDAIDHDGGDTPYAEAVI